jgi:hypothetical protein
MIATTWITFRLADVANDQLFGPWIKDRNIFVLVFMLICVFVFDFLLESLCGRILWGNNLERILL